MRALSLLVIALAVLFSGPKVSSGKIPPVEGMLYVEWRYLSPTIVPGSFEASTRKLWRSGKKFLRHEEEPDPKAGIHGLIITVEPDSWLVNLYTKEARHIVDPGPTFNVRAPIIPSEEGQKLRELEFGNELSFFKKHGAKMKKGESLGEVDTVEWYLELEGTSLVLIVEEERQIPVLLNVENKKTRFGVKYESYKVGLPFDPILFQLPGGISVIEK